MYPPTIQKLIDLFSKFPTVGPRTASRFVFYLIHKSKEKLAETSPYLPPRAVSRRSAIEELIKAISDLEKNIQICPLCFNLFERKIAKTSSHLPPHLVKQGEAGEFCQICSNPSRNNSLLCIVANETDLQALEKTKKYQGLYFILGGTVSLLKKADIEQLRINELQKRIKNYPEIKEIILALNPTPDGEATTLYLERLFRTLNKKITRLGRGLPIGAELEYADEKTISLALEGRK